MSTRNPPQTDQQLDFFVAAFADIAIRDQRDMMERPFFSLAKKPRMTPIEYNVGDVSVRVSPVVGGPGIATIWDADILIWAATQITEARDRGGETSPVIRCHPHNLLKGIRRPAGGVNYKRLKEALRRLSSTYIETNIRMAAGKKRSPKGFHWLDFEWFDDQDGNPLGISITLAKWVYDGIIEGGGVLTIHEDYFLLTGGIERWLYRVARKHAGSQENGWQFTMRQLYEKSGSAARFSDFALDVRKVISANTLPEYFLEIARNAEGDEIVYIRKRSLLPGDHPLFQLPRNPRRRHGGGITEKTLELPPPKARAGTVY